MSKLVVNEQTVKSLLSDKRDFLIPDYQRPYSWGEKECQTLWDDVVDFSFPDNKYENFNSEESSYFLGPIVTFINHDKRIEIIDGQQRLTTLMLLLRAFFDRIHEDSNRDAKDLCDEIARCIWKTDELGKLNYNKTKIITEVATDDEKKDLNDILINGKLDNNDKSKYAEVYNFFYNKINDFSQKNPFNFIYLPARILNNCILLPIEAENQDTALRIFSTLNDRGKPLSDTDIFKARLYKFYLNINEKEEFIERWKKIEDDCDDIFENKNGSSMDEIFTRYMYYERAKQKNRNNTTEALRKFYEKNNYELLNNDYILTNIEYLTNFWVNINKQIKASFSETTLKKLFVLNYAPNSMWTYIVSVYFLKYRKDDNSLEEEPFNNFLDIVTAFVLSYSFVFPGVNSLRTPLYPEMINIVDGKTVTFSDYRISSLDLQNILNNYSFTNGRPITKSLLVWWAFQNDKQKLISLNTKLEIEHIFAKKRYEKENGLKDKSYLDSLGNKSIIEKSINIRASDYKFNDKKMYYRGYTNTKGKEIKGTDIAELYNLHEKYNDFKEEDIINRKKEMLDSFITFVKNYNILK